MNAQKYTIGIDLGDRRHAVCVLNARGTIVCEEAIINTRECLTIFAQRHPGALVVMETGTHSPWVSRLFEALGHRVIVANARKVRAISTNPTKNDQEDARMLARLGRADPALLSPVQHRSEAAQRALVHLKVRAALVWKPDGVMLRMVGSIGKHRRGCRLGTLVRSDVWLCHFRRRLRG